MAKEEMDSRTATCRLARVMVVVFVCMTATISLTWSHIKLMGEDEMYQFQTDSVGSLTELVHVQRNWPISLDPLLDHVLSHGAMQIFGAGAFGLRLPSLLGFLLMQACLFFFVRNLSGERAGVVAAAFPALTATLFYSTEGRPYGLMLGLYALAILCWQVAERQEARSWSRKCALAGLAVAIAATINAHYFGILLLVPITAAEGFRTFQRRRVDWPVVTAIMVGAAGYLGTIPFLKAAVEYRRNYYNLGQISYHDITQAYQSLFVAWHTPQPIIDLEIVLMIFPAAAVTWRCVQVVRRRDLGIPAAEWVLALSLALLPVWNYLLARFVTHSIVARYASGTVVAIGALVAVAASPWLRRDRAFIGVMALMGLGIVLWGGTQIWAEQLTTRHKLASLALSQAVSGALAREPGRQLYIQNMTRFEGYAYYEPDEDVRSRMTLVYSSAKELRWGRQDTMALTAVHLEHFAGLPIVSYETLKATPGEHLFVVFHGGRDDWTDQAFAQDGAKVRPVGKLMDGDVAAVEFR